MSFSKYIPLYFRLVAAGIRAQMQYRFAFIMRIVGLITAYVGMTVTTWVMLYRFDSLDGWNFHELLFLLALAITSWGVCITFFFHFNNMDTYIVNGTFDRFLVRPINPFFHFMSMRFDVGSLGQFIFSAVAFVIVSVNIGIHWSFSKVLFTISAVVGGVLIQGGLLVIIAAIAFWTTKSNHFYWVVMYPTRNLINYPLSIYPRVIQWITAFIIPFGFINYFPATVILDKEPSTFPIFMGYLSAPIGIVFFLVSYAVWMLGFKHYKSAGS